MRVRSNTPLWGWNPSVASRITISVLIIAGEFDTGGGGVQDLPELYDSVPNPNKLWIKVQCAGHFMPCESQRTVLHHVAKQWLKHGAVEGCTRGRFFVDNDGNMFPQNP